MNLVGINLAMMLGRIITSIAQFYIKVGIEPKTLLESSNVIILQINYDKFYQILF